MFVAQQPRLRIPPAVPMVLVLVLALVAASIAVFGGGATSARSETVTRDVQGLASAERPMRVVKRAKFADIICVKKRTAKDQPGRCRGVAVLKASRPYRRPNSARGDRVRCREWWGEMRGLYYVNWRERAEGTFCWAEGPSAPDVVRNNWTCGYSSAIGYDVQHLDCWDGRRTGDTTYGWWISVYDKFRVSALARGIPLHWTYQFHVNLHPTGTFSMFVDHG